ncbi:hypothetical protein [Neptuniibacter marinus]|uniref:hypothetical protein n=1 Tax=Neptuniibacter marinus TaxID=1806670 RepID=UPI003B58F486
MFDKKTTEFAAQQLNLPTDWILRYQSIQVGFVFDTETLAEQLDTRDPDDDDCYTTLELIDDAFTYVDLPEGIRLIGMCSPSDSENMKFGLVDFSPLGAA